MTDPVRAYLDAADAALRSASHEALTAHPTPQELYARAGSLTDLLRKLEHLTRRLSEEVARIESAPPAGLRSDDDTSPTIHVWDATGHLRAASTSVDDAGRLVDRAQGSLSHLATDG
jgi:hypothetical protein